MYTQNMKYLLLFHGNKGYANCLSIMFMHTFPVVLYLCCAGHIFSVCNEIKFIL
jgi:hypothetical protein